MEELIKKWNEYKEWVDHHQLKEGGNYSFEDFMWWLEFENN